MNEYESQPRRFTIKNNALSNFHTNCKRQNKRFNEVKNLLMIEGFFLAGGKGALIIADVD